MAAVSDLDVQTHLNSMSSYSGIKLGSYYYGVDVGTTKTTATVAGKLSTYGDIEILAKDNINSNIDTLVSLNAGLINGGTSKVEGKISSQNATINIGNGKNSDISAPYGNISALATTSAKMTDSIQTSSYGLGSKGNIEANNTYTRNTTVNVKDGTTMLAGGGIAIYADAENATITSTAKGNAAGVVNKGTPSATIRYTENTKVNIGGGCDLTAQLGDNRIVAQTDSSLTATASYEISIGGFDSINSEATVNSTVNVQVNIAENSKNQTNIYGANVEIASYIKNQNHEANSNSKCTNVGSKTIATSKVNSKNNLLVNIGNAIITGYETLYIYSVAQKLMENAVSRGRIIGVTGKVYGNSEVSGSTNGSVNVGSSKYKAILRGPDIIIENIPANGISTYNSVKRDASAVGDTIVSYVTKTIQKVEEVVEKVCDWLPWPFDCIVRWVTKKVTKWVTEIIKVVTYSDCDPKQLGNYSIGGNVYVNLDLYCGEHAAGINILVNEDRSYITTGLANPSNYIRVDDANKAIYIHDIRETKNSKFSINTLGNNVSGNVKIFDTSYIPAMNIDNYSDYKLYIQKVFLASDAARSINKNITMNIPSRINVTTGGVGEGSKVNITNYGSGDLVFLCGSGDTGRSRYNDFDAGAGKINIKMNGGSVYTDDVAFIAANDVAIEGAKKIGNTSSDRTFSVRLVELAPINNQYMKRDAKSASLSLKATDEVRVNITPVMLVFSDKSETNRTPNYLIRNLEANNITLSLNRQMYTTMYMPNYGTGRGTTSVREYLTSATFPVDFWFDRIVATNSMLVVMNSYPYGNAIYRLMVDYKGYNVKSLRRMHVENVKWIMYNQPSNGSSSETTYPAIRKQLEKELENANKKDKLPELKHLSKGIKNKLSRTGRLGNGNLINSLLHRFNIATDLNSDGLDGAFAQLLGAVDFVRIVDMGAWSYIITANDMSVRAMKAVVNAVVMKSNGGGTAVNKILNSMLKNAAVKNFVTSKFNFNLLFLPLAALLVIFLFLTRKRREQEVQEVE